MSDAEESDNIKGPIAFEHVNNITNAQFSAYLRQAGASQKCLSCGKDSLISIQDTNWNKLHDEDDYENLDKHSVLRLFRVNAEQNHPEWDLPSISLLDYEFRIVCKSCGHVTSYSAYLVYKWLAKKVD